MRDGIDLKRIMITVAMALTPCILMACYNTGYQANLALAELGLTATAGWRGQLSQQQDLGYDPTNIAANMFHGFLYWFPVFLVTNMVGGFWEGLFAMVRKHEINEGFLSNRYAFPINSSTDDSSLQVALGISFGVVFGKEVFGGTGKNFLNPALTARAFLFFAYPGQISGDAVWTAVDGYTGATALGLAATGGPEAITAAGITWTDAFLRFRTRFNG